MLGRQSLRTLRWDLKSSTSSLCSTNPFRVSIKFNFGSSLDAQYRPMTFDSRKSPNNVSEACRNFSAFHSLGRLKEPSGLATNIFSIPRKYPPGKTFVRQYSSTHRIADFVYLNNLRQQREASRIASRTRASFSPKPSPTTHHRMEKHPYHEDPESGRWPLYMIGTINLLIYAGWEYSKFESDNHQDHEWINFMLQNFTLNWSNITQGRPWVLLTQCVSHNASWHFLFNMVTLFSLAPPVIAMIGPGQFVSLWIFSGLFSGLVSLQWTKQVETKFRDDLSPPEKKMLQMNRTSLGASGPLYSVLTVLTCLLPSQRVLLFFVIPIKLKHFVLGACVAEPILYLTVPGWIFDTPSHVGGIVAGFLAWRFRIRPKLMR